MPTTKFKHTCAVEDAPKIWEWIQTRGGVAVWKSADLSDPGKSWTTPYKNADGTVKEKQNWRMENTPSLVITDPAEIEVSEDREVNRFRVALLAGFLVIKCSEGSSRKIRKAVAQAGTGAYHVFDYGTQEAVIYAPTKTYSLDVWAACQVIDGKIPPPTKPK